MKNLVATIQFVVEDRIDPSTVKTYLEESLSTDTVTGQILGHQTRLGRVRVIDQITWEDFQEVFPDQDYSDVLDDEAIMELLDTGSVTVHVKNRAFEISVIAEEVPPRVR